MTDPSLADLAKQLADTQKQLADTQTAVNFVWTLLVRRFLSKSQLMLGPF